MYTDLAAALNRVKERSGATAQDDSYLTELLTASAGKNAANETIYRPYFCAAKWIEQNRAAQTLKEADGVKFTGLTTVISSLFVLQDGFDKAFALTVPAGFEAQQTEEQTTTTTIRRVPRSHTPNLRP
jgi:hypothetical protein